MLGRHLLKLTAAMAVVLVVATVAFYFLFFETGVPEARYLRPFVRSHPDVPVVFTSRSEPASFQAAPPEAEGFTYPGTLPWVTAEGRLRLLDTDGKVYELTWGRDLPDGGTLIDVMSPSVSLDGKRVLFAGRRAPPDPGRWRIYEVGVDGRNLRPLTGGPDDPGCVALPPMRYAADGSVLPPDDRRRIDYDDVDPVDQGLGFVFASSRLPDLGRDHACRATQIWVWPTGKAEPHTLTANRNNDRWPYLTFAQDLVVFSQWSRNREAVTADGADVRPVSAGGTYLTRPTDQWVGARVAPSGVQFGYTVKIPEPVWRPRPLFNGRLAFMTAHPAGGGRLRLAQADWGYLRSAPSSLAADSQLPNQVGGTLLYAPDRDGEGRELTLGCPSPFPDHSVLCSGARAGATPGEFGLYLLPDDWSAAAAPTLLFDDPRLVDAEPVAVYPRTMPHQPAEPQTMGGEFVRPTDFRLANGQAYDGPLGRHHSYIVNREMTGTDPFPGQQTDTGAKPVVPFPTGITSIAIYAAGRDRFDDPAVPRIPGPWERLLVVPLEPNGDFTAWVPANPAVPTVLAGLGKDGKVFKWTGGAKDSAGRSATFFALAGDHYSGTLKNGHHFCLGCHTGHTFIPADIRERVAE